MTTNKLKENNSKNNHLNLKLVYIDFHENNTCILNAAVSKIIK